MKYIKRTWVKHPRYGNKPMKSYFKFADEEVINSFYHNHIANNFFLKSAIPVTVSNLKNAFYPKSFYVDIELTCRQCKRASI